MIDKDLDTVMQRIEKLLAMANDGRGNINEAATAMSMANKLMAKHQLDHSDVIQAALLRGDDLSDENIDIPGISKNCPTWLSTLIYAIAKYNDCQVRNTRDNRNGFLRFKLYGMTSDVQVGTWMFTYAVSTITKLCNTWAKESADFSNRPHNVSAMAAKRAYKGGCASALWHKIEGEIKKEQENQLTSTTSSSLLVIKQKALEEKYGPFKYGTSESREEYNAASISGYIDGSKIDLLRKAVGSQEDAVLRLQ